MYCKQCGKQIDDDSRYCVFCGTKHTILQPVNSGIIHATEKPGEEKPNKPNLNLIEGNIEYDATHKRDYLPTFVGIGLLIALSILSAIIGNNDPGDGSFGIILLIIAILSAIWCVNIASKLNRNQVFWGIFGFVLPFIALIIIGLLRKKLYGSDYAYSTDEEKSSYNNNLAYRISKQGNYNNALILVNRAITQDPKNHAGYDTRAYIKYYLEDYGGALEDSNTSINFDSNAGVKFDHRGYINMRLGNKEDAMKDWETAVEKGFENSKRAIEKYSNEFSN